MKDTKNQYHLINILKLLTLLAIVTLHINEFVFYQDKYPFQEKALILSYTYYLTRLFSLGGQILISIVYFTFGLSEKSNRGLLFIGAFAMLGQISLGIIFQTLEWDIYSYIAITNLLIIALPKNVMSYIISATVSLIMLWIPTHYFQDALGDSPVAVIMTGKLAPYHSGSWPMLPWFFIALLAYSLGQLSRIKSEVLKTMKAPEKIFWFLLILIAIPQYGATYAVPLGPHFYQFVFNQRPLDFWSNFLPFVITIRLALIAGIQNKLKENKFVLKLSNLCWSKNLGVTYIVSLFYVGGAMNFEEYFIRHPLSYDIFFISVMPACEIIVRIFLKILPKKRAL